MLNSSFTGKSGLYARGFLPTSALVLLSLSFLIYSAFIMYFRVVNILYLFVSCLQAAVCRCSQPLSGFSARCLEDEHMLQAISKANHNSRYIYVMDTRPKVEYHNCFTFMHLADTFIQSDFRCIQAICFFISMRVPWESNP